jgi:hypothetical protein
MQGKGIYVAAPRVMMLAVIVRVKTIASTATL